MATAANTVNKIQKFSYATANNTTVYNSDLKVQGNISVTGTYNSDLTVVGNLTVLGSQTYAQTQTLLVRDNIITLNAAISQSGTPLFNAGIEVDRGNQPNVSFIWNESSQAWQFTSDGTTYESLGGGSSGVYANAAFIQANAAFNVANTGSSDTFARTQANASFIQANAAFNAANNASDSWVRNQANLAYTHANSSYAFANASTAWGTRQAFKATAGQTVFSIGSGYLPGSIDVYYNGLKLYGTEDYTATDGINVTLTNPATVNSVIEIVGFGANSVAANVYVLNSMNSMLQRQTFFATGGQTTFTVTGGYRVGYVDVYYNGLKINIPEDVTANNGSTIDFIGLTPTTNDIIEIVGLTPNVALANAIPITGGTISGGLTLAGNVNPVTDNTYYLGSATNRWHSLFVGPGSVDIGGLKLSNVGGVLSVAAAGAPATPIAGEDTWVRTQANSSFIKANLSLQQATSAYDSQNTTGTYANAAFTQANAAFASANNVAPQIAPAFTQANAAFIKANSGVQYGANTSSNSFIAVPSGTTAERTATSNGALRYNTTLGQLETYFTSGGWIGLVRENFTAEVVVVAGGGGGGGGFNHSAVGSGGGAGGYLYGTITNISFGATYTIIVGAGGVGGAEGVAPQGQNSSGGDGSNSSITFGGATLLNSIGGGGGVTYEDKVGRFGGSGSGGSGAGASQPAGGSGVVGPPRQGYPGGSAGGSSQSNGTTTGGGGGGAGGIGGNGVTGGAGGAGGIGIVNSFDGSTSGQLSSGLYYLAGGGGGGTCGGPGGTAGTGGGGAGGTGNNNGSNGTTNTGGGAGGAGNTNSGARIGGIGGSGVIIIRYLGPQRASGGTVTSNGSYTYHTFTGSGSFIA